jgi:small subunit ribosomal protein S21
LKGVKNLVQVNVHAGNVEQALRALKKKMQREGIFRVLKLKKHYEKPTEKRKRKEDESFRRKRKLDRKRYLGEE